MYVYIVSICYYKSLQANRSMYYTYNRIQKEKLHVIVSILHTFWLHPYYTHSMPICIRMPQPHYNIAIVIMVHHSTLWKEYLLLVLAVDHILTCLSQRIAKPSFSYSYRIRKVVWPHASEVCVQHNMYGRSQKKLYVIVTSYSLQT